MPCKAGIKANTKGKQTVNPDHDIVPAALSDSISAHNKACPKPWPKSVATAAAPEVLTSTMPPSRRLEKVPKASKSLPAQKKMAKHTIAVKGSTSNPAPLADDNADSTHQSEDLESAPPPWQLRICKVAVPPEFSNLPQPSKKALAAQAKAAKLQKEEAWEQSIQTLEAYEKKVIAMGFEKTPVPPPPGAAPSRSNKLPGIFNQRVHNVIAAMDVDEGGEFEDFVAEMVEIDDDSDPDEGGTLWPGFWWPVKVMSMQDCDDEEGDLFKMDALTSEADAILMSFPSKKSDEFVMLSEEDLEDIEETPVAWRVVAKLNKLVAKGKGKQVAKVMKEGKAVAVKLEPTDKMSVPGKDKNKKTKGVLLQEQITSAWDGNWPNSGKVL